MPVRPKHSQRTARSGAGGRGSRRAAAGQEPRPPGWRRIVGHRHLGHSVERLPIRGWFRAGRSKRTVLIMGGFHGDEPKSAYMARRLIELLENDPATAEGSNWIVVPVVNPDGLVRRTRRNANRVDLNRNFPTCDWRPGSKRSRMYGGASPASEPETRIVIELIERYRPDRVVTIHSIDKNRFCNNYNGPARRLAQAMARYNHYPVEASIGYPTPGSFGTWAGHERRIPVITLELPSHHSPKRCWEDNREALLFAVGS